MNALQLLRAALAVVVAAPGCGVDATPETGILVRGASRYTDDVGGFSYTLIEAGCDDGEPLPDAELHTATVRAEHQYLPDDEVAGDGEAYGEHYFALVPGCYNVTSQPLREGTDEPSARCRPAHARAVEVFDGLTTELLLVSQCLVSARALASHREAVASARR